jgi:hypothetical protein
LDGRLVRPSSFGIDVDFFCPSSGAVSVPSSRRVHVLHHDFDFDLHQRTRYELFSENLFAMLRFELARRDRRERNVVENFLVN